MMFDRGVRRSWEMARRRSVWTWTGAGFKSGFGEASFCPEGLVASLEARMPTIVPTTVPPKKVAMSGQ
jgi:hypothetical protein